MFKVFFHYIRPKKLLFSTSISDPKYGSILPVNQVPNLALFYQCLTPQMWLYSTSVLDPEYGS